MTKKKRKKGLIKIETRQWLEKIKLVILLRNQKDVSLKHKKREKPLAKLIKKKIGENKQYGMKKGILYNYR